MLMGIDPGVSGALAVLDGERLVDVYDMPTMQDGKRRQVNAAAVAKLIRAHSPAAVVVEAVHSMPGQGVASSFAFGQSLGAIHGVVAALGIPLHTVTPQSWKRRAGLIGTAKDQARAKAQQMYPGAPLARVKDQGRADAILIARYWK